MQFSIIEESLVEVSADLAVIWVNEDDTASIASWSESIGSDVGALMEQERFTGKRGSTFLIRGAKGVGASRLLFVGVGDEKAVRAGSVRIAAAAAAREAASVRASQVSVAEFEGKQQQIVEGFVLGGYKFNDYLSLDDDAFSGIEKVSLAFSQDAANRVNDGEVIASAVNHARDLVNHPPNEMYPETLANAAADIAKFGNLECKIFDEKELEEKGMNLIIAVGKGSINPPRLIHLTYRPEGDVQHVIGFVGKGVTFDTGGYNLKPGASMLGMHGDMGGAAAVLGAAKAIAELRPPNVEVHFVVPTAENAIANNAFKPQDIFRGYGGKTVEIHNTDAEGRLILADALAYVQEQGVETIVDLATLTGACVVALGDYTAGLFTNDDGLASALMDAADRSGEDYWRMPLTAKLDKQLDTPMADMKNLGKRWGGAITAGLFLKRWVDIDSWCHLDIAGPAWAEANDDLTPKGGTGFGVSTLVQYVQGLAKES